MRNRSIIPAAALVAAGLAAPAMAQDSVSRFVTGLPGDALSPWATDQQCASYIVTPTEFQSSWGNNFVIAPLVKTSKLSSDFFSSQISTQTMSATLLEGAPYASSQYWSWSGPGFGVNLFGAEPPNLAGDLVSPTGMSNQFAVAVSEFGDPRANNIVGGIVNLNPNDSSQLFVTRIVGAVNKPNEGTGDSSQLGLGAIDSMGNFTFRADSFQSTGPNQIPNENVLRAGMLDRDCGTLNLINNAGASDTGVWLVANSSVTHNVPSIIPEEHAGRPIYIGPNFDGQYVFEVVPGFVSNTTAHLTGADHRGGITYSQEQFFAGSIGTAGILQRPTGGSNDRITIWGVASNGSVTGTRQFIHPSSITDGCDPFTFVPATVDTFQHHLGATAFRGGAQVSIGADQAGRGLVSATSHTIDIQDDPFSALSVARFDPNDPGAPAEWTVAAWSQFVPGGWPRGKYIYDGAGNEIGKLTALLQVTGGAPSPTAPSISAPFIDSVGNIYFLSAIQLFDGNPDDDDLPFEPGQTRPSGATNIYTSGLVRAVYDPDEFCYRLELVFRNRDVFLGQDSDREWQIQFLSIAAANSRVAPSTFWAHNGIQSAWGNMDASMLDPEDPRTLGGLIVSATITYDVDMDGEFVNPTAAGGDPNSLDESYNVLLFVGPAAPSCPWDLTGSGSVGSGDLGTLLGCWGPNPTGPCVAADFTGSNSIGSADLAVLLGSWGPCPQ